MMTPLNPRAVAQAAIASGDLIPLAPTLFRRPSSSPRNLNISGPQGADGKTQATLAAEAKLDRVISFCKFHSPLARGELARIARKEGVDYQRLKKRMNGTAKFSRIKL